jgi:hypothetical protein
MGFYKDGAPPALPKYPEGITSFNPALPRRRSGNWGTDQNEINSEGVETNGEATGTVIQP